MSALSTFNKAGRSEMVIVLWPEHYLTCHEQGWDKDRVQQFLQEHAFRTRANLIRGGSLEEELKSSDEEERIYAVKSPDEILLLVAGGEAGRFSACIPGWGSQHYCRSVIHMVYEATCGT